MPGGLGASDQDQAATIRQLESVIETYKHTLSTLSRDSRELEEKLAKGAGLVDATLLEEAESKAESLSNTISALESSISELQSANTTLDAEVNDLWRRVWSGEYDPKRERVVELVNNPAAKVMAVRQKMLDDLKAENEALLHRLGGVEKEGSVPKESWERLVKEKEETERAHAKRLQRLKEVSCSCHHTLLPILRSEY
jgi:mitotic spindle assembly checkpoint protein MAD1